MEQPKGFIAPRLIKSLGGPKQAPKQWHDDFDQVLLTDGFKINESDKCVCFKLVGGSCIIIFL